MLTATRRPAAATRRHSRRDTVATAVSLLLHAAAVGFLLLGPRRPLPPPNEPLEVEMIQQPEQVRGAPPPPAPAPPTPESKAAPAQTASPPPPPLPQAKDAPAETAAGQPSAPSPQSRPQPPAKQTAPTVNLGNAGEDLDALTVTGKDVVPPAPDARYRNLPPHYPQKAAKLGAEGTVQLVVKVAPNGQALGVAILSSSGNADLDQEARRAVELWHFRPARAGGVAVPYDYVVNIRFAIGDN
jgi:protein TonB